MLSDRDILVLLRVHTGVFREYLVSFVPVCLYSYVDMWVEMLTCVYVRVVRPLWSPLCLYCCCQDHYLISDRISLRTICLRQCLGVFVTRGILGLSPSI